jgi:stage IV sporulation protein B
MDVDTKRLMNIKSGVISQAGITSVRKGTKGSPGELIGNINRTEIMGEIIRNSNYGVFGRLNKTNTTFKEAAIPIGLQSEVSEGPAQIWACVDGNSIRKFDIYITSVNKFSKDNTKNMVIRITDIELLRLTNGIVQGMSGSPIIQNGRLIGAVTHVFVQDPSRGYGIFIENMLGK